MVSNLRFIDLCDRGTLGRVGLCLTTSKQGMVSSVPSTALRFDCGSVEGFLAAIAHMSTIRVVTKT